MLVSGRQIALHMFQLAYLTLVARSAPRIKPEKTLRLASTLDPGDGKSYLSPASGHYMNFFGDAPWELCGRETFEDFCPTPYTRMCF